MIKPSLLIALASISLVACDQVSQRLGIDDPVRKEASLQAEGKAVGSACRQSGRAIEDCYSVYNWLTKASIYDGWKEMDAYMRENQLETITPQLPPAESPAAMKKRLKAEAAAAKAEKAAKEAAEGGEEGEAKPEEKSEEKSSKH